MEIMVSLHAADSVKQLKDLNATHIMINDEFFASGIDGLCNQKLKDAIESIHANGMKAVVKADRLYDQNEIKKLEEFLGYVNECGTDAILFSDVTIKTLVDKLGLALETIYAPETLLTNKYDVEALKNDAFSSCVISKDITLEDVYDIADYNKGYCFVRIHGPILISYSKRRFISIYLQDTKEYKEHYYLQEENRDIKLPVVEKDKGFWMYGYTLESFDEVKNILNKPLRGVIIDNMLYDDSYTLEVVKLYGMVAKGELTAEMALAQLKDIDEEIAYTAINDIKKTFLEKE